MKNLENLDLTSGKVMILAGIAAIGGGVGLTVFGTDPNVPNDPNIGAGLLFLLGISVLIAGIITARSQRKSTLATPPPPTP